MSRVTNAILTAHVGLQDGSDLEIDSVNKFVLETETGGGGQFAEVTRHVGGTKHVECSVYNEPRRVNGKCAGCQQALGNFRVRKTKRAAAARSPQQKNLEGKRAPMKSALFYFS